MLWPHEQHLYFDLLGKIQKQHFGLRTQELPNNFICSQVRRLYKIGMPNHAQLLGQVWIYYYVMSEPGLTIVLVWHAFLLACMFGYSMSYPNLVLYL